jgi:cytochrome b involved in lipid metabolism
MNQHHQVSNFRPISMEELSQHSTRESAWCALNGIVYDVTIYLDFHPGGDILLQGCGKECAGLFSNYFIN